MTTNIIAVVVWTVLMNWVPVQKPLYGIIPCRDGSLAFSNYLYKVSELDEQRETAILTSNLVMRFTWKDEPKELSMESIPFLVTNRTWKTERIAVPGGSEPYIGGIITITNLWFNQGDAKITVTNAYLRVRIGNASATGDEEE